MSILEQLNNYITSKQYIKLVRLLQTLAETQKQSYQMGFNIYEPSNFSPALLKAIEQNDGQFVYVMMSALGYLTNNQAVLVHAAMKNKTKVINQLFENDAHIPSEEMLIGLNNAQKTDLSARFSLIQAIKLLQQPPSLLAKLLEYDKQLIKEIDGVVDNRPDVLGEFIDDICSFRRKLPFTVAQWEKFVSVIAEHNARFSNHFNIDKLRAFNPKMTLVLQAAAEEIVKTLRAQIQTDAMIEDCIWYFQTPRTLTDSHETAERFAKVFSFLAEKQCRFNLYLENNAKIPGFEFLKLQAQDASNQFRTICAREMQESDLFAERGHIPDLNINTLPAYRTIEWKWLYIMSELACERHDLLCRLVVWDIINLAKFIRNLPAAGLQCHFNLNSIISTFNRSALQEAASQGWSELVAELIQLPSVDVNFATMNTVLGDAVSYLPVVRVLLADQRVDIQKTTALGSALHAAVLAENKSVVAYLIESGIDPNLRDSQQRTALAIAIIENKKSVIPTLIAKITSNHPNIDWKLAEFLSIVFASPKLSYDALTLCIKELIASKSPNAKSKVNPTLLNLWRTFNFDVNTHRILLAACERGHTKIVTDLLEILLLDINRREPNNLNRPLHHAIRGKFTTITDKLLARMNLDINPEYSYVRASTLTNDVVTLNKLISRNDFNLDCLYDDDHCFLSAVINAGLYTLAETIVQLGRPVNVDFRVAQGLSPLELTESLIEAHPFLSKLLSMQLLLSKQDHNVFRNSSLSRLMQAAQRGDAVVIDTLMRIQHVNQDQVNTMGTTALSIAQATGNKECINLLKRRMIRDYDELMKVILTKEFMHDVPVYELMNRVVLCNGFYSKEREEWVKKFMSVIRQMEHPFVFGPRPETALFEIHQKEPTLILEFMRVIKDKEMPNPFAKFTTMKECADVLAKITGKDFSLSEAEYAPVPAAVAPARPATRPKKIADLLAQAPPAVRLENSQASPAVAVIPAQLSEENKLNILKMVIDDVNEHLMQAKLTLRDIQGLKALLDTRTDLDDDAFMERQQLLANAWDTCHRVGSNLAEYVARPVMLCADPQLIELALQFLRVSIEVELRRLPKPVAEELIFEPDHSNQASRVKSITLIGRMFTQRSNRINARPSGDDDDNDNVALFGTSQVAAQETDEVHQL